MWTWKACIFCSFWETVLAGLQCSSSLSFKCDLWSHLGGALVFPEASRWLLWLLSLLAVTPVQLPLVPGLEPLGGNYKVTCGWLVLRCAQKTLCFKPRSTAICARLGALYWAPQSELTPSHHLCRSWGYLVEASFLANYHRFVATWWELPCKLRPITTCPGLGTIMRPKRKPCSHTTMFWI